MTPVMIRDLGHKRSGMLKSYFIEQILLTFLKYVFLTKMDICSEKLLLQNCTPPHTHMSVCFISQINIIHEYTETVSKYTGKIGTYSMWE